MSVARANPRPAELSPAVRTGFLRLVEESYGLRITDEQSRDLGPTIARILATSDYANPAELYESMASGVRADLLAEIVATLTNGETHFFRIAPQIEALRHYVLPDLLARRATERRLSIWSAGCSTGEEPYTMAILLRELLHDSNRWDLRILGSDLIEASLATAEAASYGEWSFRETPARVRQSYFSQTGNRWLLSPSIRRMVRFARINLASDAFPSPGPSGPNLDLILCRNVTIYFSSEATQRLYSRFADALTVGGWLVLGPSDPTPVQPGPFEPVHIPGVVLWRRLPHTVTAMPPPPVSLPVQKYSPMVFASPPGKVEARPGLLENPRSARAVSTPDPPPANDFATRVQTNPLDAEAHTRLGMRYLEAGDVGQAIEYLRRATFLEPDNALAHFGRGRACLQDGDRDGARLALTQARRVLAGLPDLQVIPGGDGVTANELRAAVEATFATILAVRD